MAKADRAGDEERAALPRHAAHPRGTRRTGPDELAHRSTERNRIARRGEMAAAADGEQTRARHQRRDALAFRERHAAVVVAMDHQRWAADPARMLAHIGVQPAGESHRDGGPIGRASVVRTPSS